MSQHVQERKGAITLLAVATMGVNCAGAILSLGAWFHVALTVLFLVAMANVHGAYNREHARAMAAEAKKKAAEEDGA